MAEWTRYGRGMINCWLAAEKLCVATDPPELVVDFGREIWDAIAANNPDSVKAIAQKYGADPEKARLIYEAVKQGMD